MPQLKADDKKAILASIQRTVDVSSIDPPSAGSARKLKKAMGRAYGALPYNFNAIHHESWCEVLNMVSAGHVLDYSMGDGAVAVAAVAMNLTYGGLVLSEMHQEFCLRRVDKCLIAFMVGNESLHWRGDVKKINC